jgi:GMP synthase-like glutamine amidotransferase
MKLAVLQHAEAEGPGEIAEWAAARGHAVEIARLDRGEALPPSFDWLAVMGGEMNVYQDRDYPWLKAERRFVRATLEAGKPVVGICLGAQLLADALGSRVVQNAEHEIGWFPVSFTREARENFAHLPESATALHWHGDAFELPAGALRVGTSAGCGEQGFLVPGRCLALQFHFEADEALTRAFVEGSSDFSQWPKGRFVQSPEVIVESAARFCGENRQLLFEMLDAFFGGEGG